METIKTPAKDSSKIEDGESQIIYYGDNSQVKAVEHYDYNDYLQLNKKSQHLKNFDDHYDDFVDYIIKITHKIWEEKSIGLIYDTYHNNITIHFGAYSASGITSVISGTLQSLYAFPDRKLIAQNVIWSECDKESYYSSHRILSTATNLNESSFGPATGKRISYRTVADCVAKHNRIYEEWLVRDNLWIVEQLGFDPHEVAKRMASKSFTNQGLNRSQIGIGENMNGQLMPTLYASKDDSMGEFVMEMLSKIYNYRLFDQVTHYYRDNSVVHFICDKDLTGFNQIQGMLINLFASFPNAKYTAERITCNQKGNDNAYDVAVRWRLSGLHEGYGFFGSPSNKNVEILGINHYEIIDEKVTEEWVTFDGLDVLRQIYTSDYLTEKTEL